MLNVQEKNKTIVFWYFVHLICVFGTCPGIARAVDWLGIYVIIIYVDKYQLYFYVWINVFINYILVREILFLLWMFNNIDKYIYLCMQINVHIVNVYVSNMLWTQIKWYISMNFYSDLFFCFVDIIEVFTYYIVRPYFFMKLYIFFLFVDDSVSDVSLASFDGDTMPKFSKVTIST